MAKDYITLDVSITMGWAPVRLDDGLSLPASCYHLPMLRAAGAHALCVGLLASVGCSSTLDEFRCTSNGQCTADEGEGLCHSSGYCTFLDDANCGGYRFAAHSGDQSNQCVDDANAADAGAANAPDASGADAGLPPNPNLPIANIASVTLDCGETLVNLDGTGSQAKNGATLAQFEWTLLSPSGEVLNTLAGPPGNNFERGSTFVSGTIELPLTNLTPYMDEQALHVIANEQSAQFSYQSDITLDAGSYFLFFTIGDADLADNVSLPIGIFMEAEDNTGSIDTILSAGATLSSELVAHRINFDVSEDRDYGFMTLTMIGQDLWLDNIGIEYAGGGLSTSASTILQNRSFEEDSMDWKATVIGLTGRQEANDFLPSNLMSYGEYGLELVVTDSNGLVSLPDSIVVDHQACDE